MQQISLTTVPVETLETTLRQIIRTELEISRTTQQNDRLISSSEACKLFSPAICNTTLRTWTKQGSIPSYRIGGRVYYKYAEVFMAAKETKKYGRN